MIPTNEQLTLLWKEYWRIPLSQGLRFGQFVFNEIGYEYKNSYNVVNAFEAYTLLKQGLEW